MKIPPPSTVVAVQLLRHQPAPMTAKFVDPPPLQPPLNGRTVAFCGERRRRLQRSRNSELARILNVGERWRTVAKQRRGGFPSRGSRVQIPSPAPPILRSIKAIRRSLRLASHPKVARPP